MKNIYKLMIALALIVVFFAHPFTRQLLFFLVLPTGWDDLIVYGAGATLIVLFFIGVFNGTIILSIKNVFDWLKK